MSVSCECGYATFGQSDEGQRMIAGYIHSQRYCVPMGEEIAKLRGALSACVEVLTVMEGGSELMESEKPVLARARAALEGA